MIPRTRDSPLRGRDAVRVEDGFDVAKGGQEGPQRLHVADLGRVPVLRQLILDAAAVGHDIGAVLGKCPRDILEQAGPIPGVDGDLYTETLRAAAVPRDLGEALRIPSQRLHVGAVLAVDGDPLTEGDVADDAIPRYRGAALRQPHENVLDAVHLDSEGLARSRMARLRRLERDGLLLGDLRRLQALDQLPDDLAGRELPRAERDVEVLGLLEARLSDHLREHRRPGEL